MKSLRGATPAKLVVVVCLLMLTILQHHIQMVWAQVMLNCLRDAGLKPTDVDGVICGTSTPLGDLAESKQSLMFFASMHINEFKLN
jgi:3-oxoacyl-(acyl-carrier-protein) synthase